MSQDFLSHLNWRFAVKDFKTDQTVSSENIEKILNATQFAPSSYGLQPYHIFVVSDQKIKDQIQEAGYNQPQFGHSSAILVFCSRTDAMNRIDEFQEVASGGNPEVKEKLQGYTDVMRSGLGTKSPQEIKHWADKQAYIALGFAMAAAAELEIDSCPMEGFIPGKVDEILGLPEHMKSVVCLPVGYRTEDPKRAKFRFSKEDLFTEV